MSEPTRISTPPADDADALWNLLAERIDALVAVWEAATEPPDLAQFVPAASAAARRLGLIELAKVDMDYRRRRGHSSWQVEHYVARFPDLAHDGIPCDLIYEEYHLCRQAGEAVAAEHYLQRFPNEAEQLRRLFDLPQSDRTTSLFVPVVSAPLDVGQTIDDFDLLTRLGSGAFATVYLARQRSLQRLVALKASANAGSEPQTLAQLDHPHIVRVYDQRVLADEDMRLLYMQYVPGGTLQDVVRRARETPPAQLDGRLLLRVVDEALDRAGQSPPSESSGRQIVAALPWPQLVCRLGQQLASALHYAHQRGVLHRDLKPANVLVAAEGSPKLADFNISFCSKLDGANPAAYFGGSLAYMSPEQLEAASPNYARQPESLDGRSDIYSLGVLLWELLMLSRPFIDEPLQTGWNATVDEMLARRRQGLPATAIAALPLGTPPGMVEVLRSCLAPLERDRPRDAGELAAMLRLCQRPEAQRLFATPAPRWRRVAQTWCASAVVLSALVPNALAAWFNLVYNRAQIVALLPQAQEKFWAIQLATNSIAFPLGIAVLVWLSWPVQQAIARRRRTDAGGDPTDQQARLRALRLGHLTAVVGIIEWTIAGISYPIAMRLAGVKMGAPECVHFVASLALCGMIAATYPFFATTFLGVQAFYPALVPREPATPRDAQTLDSLGRLVWVYTGLAASLPMLAVVLLVSLGGGQSRLALGVLSAVSLAGFGLIFYLARTIQRSIATILWVVEPASSGDSPESGSFIVPR